jgi:lipoyl synthase
MVARDDLADGGMAHVAGCVEAIRRVARHPGRDADLRCEGFDAESLDAALRRRPDVLNHNLETVARLQRAVRPSAGYARSLSVLALAKDAGLVTKSSLMVGMSARPTTS